jgi:hypothetical protein
MKREKLTIEDHKKIGEHFRQVAAYLDAIFDVINGKVPLKVVNQLCYVPSNRQTRFEAEVRLGRSDVQGTQAAHLPREIFINSHSAIMDIEN